MPFSMAGENCCRKSYRSFLFYNIFNSLKNVTLQVRIRNHEERQAQQMHRCRGRKAFLSAPRETRDRRRSLMASLTLEAAIALTIFLFASVCMMLPMKIMNTDRKLQAALESVGEDFSRYAYLKDILDRGEAMKAPGAGDFARAFCKHLVSGMAEGYVRGRISEHIDTTAVRHVRMIRSSILEEDGIVDLVLDYEIQLPFPVLGLKAVERTVRCRRRAWIGKAGTYGEPGKEPGDGRDETVYVGKNSTRYHRNRSCHYLANNLSAVIYEEVSKLRNEGGGKYHACRVCASGAGSGSTIYIMPSGDSYHATKSCRAIVAYVRAVRLSEVENLGSCSYCSR